MFTKNKIKILTLIIALILILIPQTIYASDEVKLDISRQVINNYTYKELSHNQVVLKWTEIDNADCYKIYKYNSAQKKYILYKTLNGDKAATLKMTGLSPITTYRFKVKAYQDDQIITSEPLKVKTSSKTTGYFRKKVILDSEWNGVLITDTKATNIQMSRYRINGQKTAIKYNYSASDKTLYIHVYAKFVGNGVNQKFAYYKQTPTGWKQYKLSKYTNKQLVMSGIQQCWNISVKGKSYDFMTGCNFKTKVIFHTDILPDQCYIKFNIGNEECYYNPWDAYWFFALDTCYISGGSPRYNYTGDGVEISLSTNHQLKKNEYYCVPLKSIEDFKDTVAHEFGHVLGLNDAYNLDNNGKIIKRIVKNSETGYYTNGQFNNVMYSSDNVHAVANDIEMILQGQGMAINEKKYSFQSYASYTDDCGYKKSPVIRK